MEDSNAKKTNIGIFGFGNMGQAIFNSLKKNQNLSFYVYSLDIDNVEGAACAGSIEELVEKSDIVFLCIKPQEFASLEKIKIKKELIYISIMAGVKIEKISDFFASDRIVRTMPNLNLLVGQAVIGYYANKQYFTAEELETIKRLLHSFGEYIQVEKESDLDAITAVSGSGPAYVFLFINALIKSAQSLGFDEEAARKMALETVAGSLKYLENMENFDLEDLIAKVKSKGGTTEAALESLGVDNFYSAWEKAIRSARNRAEELSNGK